jgi:L-threonylcarbamoyladenylate synthase
VSTRLPTGTDEEREEAVRAATDALTRGQLVVIPTDTVYGLAADAFDTAAVASLLAAKGRGRSMPPPVLVSAQASVDALASELPDYARALVERFWPGPLTIVARQQPSLSWDLGETRGTVAIRMPDEALALEILERTGPLAVSSANTTGELPATTAEEAERMLGDHVGVIVDTGPTLGVAASTIVDVTGATPRILRRGVIPVDEIDEVLEPFGVTALDED